MSRPRKMSVAKTQYFDVIFCEESFNTANFVIQNADFLYEKAFEQVESAKKTKTRIPIVISPDSDKLDISYSPTPYNRIVIFEGVPTVELSCFENTLLSLLYQEITKAVNYSVRSKFMQFVSVVAGTDALQPVSLINLPFSFAEGFSFVENSQNGQGLLNDRFALQQLVLAKMQGNFPNWMQVSVIKDEKNENDFSSLAGAAFIAFVQQRWGMEKFLEFWKECGNLHFYLTSGIFEKVYDITLSSAWKDFVESIPLPDNLTQMEYLEEYSEKVIKKDTEGSIKNIISTPYGLIWYDNIRHEVDIIDTNENASDRKLLFLASDVNRITVSPNGRYLAVSFTQIKNRPQFKSEVSWIYDLKERSFLSESYNLRDAAIFQLENGLYVLAGVNVKKKYPELEVYTIPSINNNQSLKELSEEKSSLPRLLYNRSFSSEIIVSCPVFVENDILYCVIYQNLQSSILSIKLSTKQENVFQIYDSNSELIKIWELNVFDSISNLTEKKFSFSYMPNDKVAFSRLGYFTITKDFALSKVFLQQNDLLGGINFPVLCNDKIYYSSNHIKYDDLKDIPFDSLLFTEGIIKNQNIDIPYFESEPEINFDKKNYYSFPYWFNGTLLPLFPIKDISLEKGPELWPGLGVTYITSTDPLLNTNMTISSAFGYLKLNFEYFTSSIAGNSQKLLNEIDDFYNDWAFSFFVKNTSTPIDISVGSIFSFIPSEGTYQGNVVVNTAWQIPMGMQFRKLNMNIQSEFIASTDYFDKNQTEQNPSLSNWPSFNESYKSFLIQSNVEYSNIHQYGLSPFEQRGLSISSTILAMWDINKSLRDIKNSEASSFSAYAYNFLSSVEQFTFGLSAKIAIPRLTPLTMKKGFVLSVPATLSLDVFKEIGTALKFNTEFVLLGAEINQGIPVLNMYFSRIGVKVGYVGALLYDTQNTPLPNILNIDSFRTAFTESVYSDYLSFIVDLDFVPVIGRLSEIQFNTSFCFQIYLHQKAFMFNFNMEFKY